MFPCPRWLRPLAALALCAALGACDREPDPVDPVLAAAARRRAERLDPRRVPDALGAEHAVALTAALDGTAPVVSAHDDTPDRPSAPYALSALPVALAALRAGLLASPFECTATRCPRPHGAVSPASTVALPCLDHLGALAPRLGTSALGSAFRAFDLDPGPLPESPLARQSLVLGTSGWRVAPRDLLAYAARLARPRDPFPAPLADALTLTVDPFVAGPLRGVCTGGDDEAWFVGFAHSPVDRLVVVRAAGCPSGCVTAAVRIARWSLDATVVPLHAPQSPSRSRAAGSVVRSH